MRPDRHPGALLLLGLLMAAGGCSLDARGGRSRSPPPVAVTESHESTLIGDYLRTLDRLGSAGNAEQADLVESARRAVAGDPTPANRLKLALVLAAPGHAGANTAEARVMLTELLGTPERLLPLERALADIMLAAANAKSDVDTENQRLRDEATRRERERAATLNRRIQALSAENEQLRRDLEEANAKLDAIATLERQMSGDRRSGSNGANP